MNIHVQLFVWTHILCIHLGLNCWLITFNFLRNCRAIFQAAASFYSSTSSEWVSPFLHIHDKICYYLCFACSLLLYIFLSLMTNVVEHPFICLWVNSNQCLIIFSLWYLWYTLCPTSWGCGGREFSLRHTCQEFSLCSLKLGLIEKYWWTVPPRETVCAMTGSWGDRQPHLLVTPAHVGLPSTELKEAKAPVPQILCSYWDLEEFLEKKFLHLLYAFRIISREHFISYRCFTWEWWTGLLTLVF